MMFKGLLSYRLNPVTQLRAFMEFFLERQEGSLRKVFTTFMLSDLFYAATVAGSGQISKSLLCDMLLTGHYF
jgi:hypothetical protein